MKNNMKYHMLTLLELIITLGIVAALASLFLDNLADSKARACEEQTIQKGEAVQKVITGGRAGGFSDFLSDMGRWPRVCIPKESEGGDQGTDDSIRGGRRLAEFYDPTVWYQEGEGSSFKSALSHEETVFGDDIHRILNLPLHDTFPDASSPTVLFYPDVTMAVGWRGPYLNLSRPMGAKYFDGWGRSWKIVTNYNMKTHSSDKRLMENESGANALEVKDAFAAEGDKCRIDGVISYGADGAKDADAGEILPTDADRKFIFAHPMDVFQKNRLASLNIRLKVRGEKGDWVPAADVREWQPASACSYACGSLVIQGTSLYVCRKNHSHTAGGTWDTEKNNWLDLSNGSIQKEDDVFNADAAEDTLRISRGWVCRKKNASHDTENKVNDTNWEKLFEVNRTADSISILLFVPVMKKTDGNRHLKLGQYHFFTNAQEENKLGVVPQYWTGTKAEDDVDAKDTAESSLKKDYSVGGGDYTAGYNPRYLVAETEWKSWNELQVERLVPGRRKIFCAFYNSKTGVYQTSQVQWLDLKPGDNFIELYLERKN